MNQNDVRNLRDRKHPVISIADDEEPIVMLVCVSQACQFVGWSTAEVNAAMSDIIFDGLDEFVRSLSVCIK